MKRAAVLAIPLVLVLVLAGRDRGASPAQAAVKRALERTFDARSSRFTVSWSGSGLPAELPLNDKVEGVMDYASRRGRISYFGESEVLYDGDVMYMKWPMPWRKESVWLRYDQGVDAEDPLNLQERALRNPIGLLQFLMGVSSDVRRVGTETVRGALSVHYEGTLDLQRVVDQARPAERAELQALLDFIREDEPTTVPFGLWVDGDGVAHRLRIDQGGGGMSVVVEYYDFGLPVTITPPRSSEVMSHDAFLREIQEHASDSDCGDSGTGLDDSLGAGSGEFSPEEEGFNSELPESQDNGGVTLVEGKATATICLYPVQEGD